MILNAPKQSWIDSELDYIVCIEQTAKNIVFFFIARKGLTMRLLLLLAEQSEQRGLGHANHLEANSGNISDSMTGTTESSNQHFIVLIDVVQATIARNESSDLLSVLDQLNTHALTNSRVGLLGLHSSRDRSKQRTTYTFSRTIPFAIVAPPRTLALIEEMLCPFLYFYTLTCLARREYLISPTLLTTNNTQLTSSTNTTRFSIFIN